MLWYYVNVVQFLWQNPTNLCSHALCVNAQSGIGAGRN